MHFLFFFLYLIPETKSMLRSYLQQKNIREVSSNMEWYLVDHFNYFSSINLIKFLSFAMRYKVTLKKESVWSLGRTDWNLCLV